MDGTIKTQDVAAALDAYCAKLDDTQQQKFLASVMGRMHERGREFTARHNAECRAAMERDIRTFLEQMPHGTGYAIEDIMRETKAARSVTESVLSTGPAGVGYVAGVYFRPEALGEFWLPQQDWMQLYVTTKTELDSLKGKEDWEVRRRKEDYLHPLIENVEEFLSEDLRGKLEGNTRGFEYSSGLHSAIDDNMEYLIERMKPTPIGLTKRQRKDYDEIISRAVEHATTEYWRELGKQVARLYVDVMEHLALRKAVGESTPQGILRHACETGKDRGTPAFTKVYLDKNLWPCDWCYKKATVRLDHREIRKWTHAHFPWPSVTYKDEHYFYVPQ